MAFTPLKDCLQMQDDYKGTNDRTTAQHPKTQPVEGLVLGQESPDTPPNAQRRPTYAWSVMKSSCDSSPLCGSIDSLDSVSLTSAADDEDMLLHLLGTGSSIFAHREAWLPNLWSWSDHKFSVPDRYSAEHEQAVCTTKSKGSNTPSDWSTLKDFADYPSNKWPALGEVADDKFVEWPKIEELTTRAQCKEDPLSRLFLIQQAALAHVVSQFKTLQTKYNEALATKGEQEEASSKLATRFEHALVVIGEQETEIECLQSDVAELRNQLRQLSLIRTSRFTNKEECTGPKDGPHADNQAAMVPRKHAESTCAPDSSLADADKAGNGVHDNTGHHSDDLGVMSWYLNI